MKTPKVTVICLCYNHEDFVEASVRSVLSQTYPNLQVIVVDDASTDGSRTVIEKILASHPEVLYLPLDHNQGNCSAFNEGLRHAEGEYVIDLSTDDLMMPERIVHQVACFQSLDQDYGIVYTDADYIDCKGNSLHNHLNHLQKHHGMVEMPEGYIFDKVLARYFIASPTMMIRREVFEALEGYDEGLAYEDFDFWVRSSRHFRYAYIDKSLTKIRKLSNSMSAGWYKKGDRQLHSTYLVCQKAQTMLQSQEEKKALIKRIQFEIRQAVFSENHEEAQLFLNLLSELKAETTFYKLLGGINTLHLPLSGIREKYHKLRYGS